MRWLFVLPFFVPFAVFPGSPLIAAKIGALLGLWCVTGYAFGSFVLRESSWDLKLFAGMAFLLLGSGIVLWLSGILTGDYRYAYIPLVGLGAAILWFGLKRS